MARLPKTSCCQSTPRCARCPVRLALEARARERRSALEQLFVDIYRGGPGVELPQAVADALATIDAARRKPAPAVL